MALMAARLPDALTAYRTEWGLKVAELPPPVAYHPFEAETLENQLPILSMAVTRSRGYARVDVAPGGVEGYEVRHSCRLYAWIKHLERAPTMAIRDDYATVMASVLLADPGLLGDGKFRLEETSLDLSYSEVSRGRGDRFIAGCSAGFDVLHAETLRRVPIGTASALTVEASVLPGHPGL